MFIVLLTYVKPLETLDTLMDEHVRFLDEQYDAGLFLVSGRRVPRSGGVILTRQTERAALEAVLAQDPFAKNGAATYELIEFTPSKCVPEMSFLREARRS